MAHDARDFPAGSLNTWWTDLQPKIQSHRTAWLNHGWVVAEFFAQGSMAGLQTGCLEQVELPAIPVGE